MLNANKSVPPIGLVVDVAPHNFTYRNSDVPCVRMILTSTGWVISDKRKGYAVYLTQTKGVAIDQIHQIRITSTAPNSGTAEVF